LFVSKNSNDCRSNQKPRFGQVSRAICRWPGNARKLVLFVGVAFCLTAPAHAAANCLKKAEKLIASHEAKMAKIDVTLTRKREELLSGYLATLSDQVEAREFEEIIEKIIARRPPPERPTPASESVSINLNLIIDAHGKHDLCNRIEAYERDARRAEANYSVSLEALHDELRDRIDIETLSTNSGLAVISAYSDGYAGRIFINRRYGLTGDFHIGPLYNAEYFRVIELPRGEYSWGKVSLNAGRPASFYYDFRDLDLNFRIEPGKLNYTGVFIFHRPPEGGGIGYIRDRTIMVMKALEDRYPELLEKYELTNGLVPHDAFLGFYLDEKAQAGARQ